MSAHFGSKLAFLGSGPPSRVTDSRMKIVNKSRYYVGNSFKNTMFSFGSWNLESKTRVCMPFANLESKYLGKLGWYPGNEGDFVSPVQQNPAFRVPKIKKTYTFLELP